MSTDKDHYLLMEGHGKVGCYDSGKDERGTLEIREPEHQIFVDVLTIKENTEQALMELSELRIDNEEIKALLGKLISGIDELRGEK